ncbi:MAG: hypothetical protein NT006_11115 [Candidatus Aminicenantes bacterium]|jgi:hypothetical protein|nr:hypothetical protein [Candidatus Aminicenantes bacterium]
MAEHPIEKGIADVVRTYELLDRVRMRQDLVIRDDQFDYEPLLDAAKYARRRRIRLSVLDTGRFGLNELEALGREGARVLTSDEARPRADEWAILLEACRASRTYLSVFWNGPLPAADGSSGISRQALEGLLGHGMDFHVSNLNVRRDPVLLAELAAVSKSGRGYFVYYHHGPIVAELSMPASRGAWVHLTDSGSAEEAWAGLAVGVACAGAAAGARAVVRVERGLPLELLEELWTAGAALLFLTPPSDDRSLLRPVETRAARRKIPARAFHLSTAFLP